MVSLSPDPLPLTPLPGTLLPDDALGLTETANECLQESRSGRNVQHQFVALLRQSVYSRLAGYEDTNDAERLSDDPTMRVIVGRRGGPERKAASTNTMSRFETEVLTQDGNVEGLDLLNAKWVDGAMTHTAHRRVILDMDSSESPVHGEQEGASYNGHFGSMCYHPLFVFNQFGDCEGAMLRGDRLRWCCQHAGLGRKRRPSPRSHRDMALQI